MPALLGLHHVTATVDDAQADLDFCLEILGLRLVKKTVNFDNHHVYHFYYGDEHGTPGTIWTTFPYKGHGVRRGVHGAGQVTATAFSVPLTALAAWRARLADAGVAVATESRFGDEVLTLRDPSGLAFELVAAADRRTPWTPGGVPHDQAIRGLHSVTATVTAPAVTGEFLERMLGFEVLAAVPDRIRLAVGGPAPGHLVDLRHDTAAPPALNGLGTVHHVAVAIGTAEEQLALREALLVAGTSVTEVRDRQYFQSIYFRIPGGVLVEVATVRPGFAVDEAPEALGRALKLPPWEEPHRAAIEAGLDRVTYRA
jgi:glyoxalase family protein